MSHELEMVNGEASMFTVKKMAWHGLGRILDKAPETSKEAITLAGLDWNVEKRDIFWKNQQEEFYKIPDRVSLVRASDQKPLSIVSDHYKVLQNSEAFDFFDPIVKSGKATYETSGSLCGGRVIWILANLNKTVEISKGDSIRRYLFLSNSHGFNKSIQIATTNVRIVCWNTLQMALASGGAFSIWHQGDMKKEMEKAKDLLGFAEKRFEDTENAYKKMAQFNLTDGAISKYIQSIIPPANEDASDRVKDGIRQEQEHIWELMETGMGSDIKSVKGTMWNAYNAFIEHVDYYAGPKVRDRGNYLIFGVGKTMKERAFDTAMEMMES
jgi:phage/plasmid-like protein (TIGR03299 family)